MMPLMIDEKPALFKQATGAFTQGFYVALFLGSITANWL